MSCRRFMAILKKQLKDTIKNKTVLIQFIMFPLMTIIMTSAIPESKLPKAFFATLFATMYIGMAPLTSIAAIISEEKEKNTLKVLMMANVKPGEYLFGIGIYIFIICSIGSVIFGVVAGYAGWQLLRFILAFMLGVIASLLVGASIGMFSKNQMGATSVTVPVMMIFSFLPMIALFNNNVEKVSKYIYTQQINYLLNNLSVSNFDFEKIMIIGINIMVFMLAFVFAYRKYGLTA